MAIRFYSWPQSSGTKVHWALEELGVPYEAIVLDREKGEHRSADYLAINPNGKVPALVDDGVAYFESLAILLHLGQAHGARANLWPADGRDRADAECFTVWSQTELHPHMMQFVYHGVDSPVSYGPDARSAAAAEYSKHMFDQALDVLEARLEKRDHVVGAFTLADVAIADSLIGARKFYGISLGPRARVTAWLDRLSQRPALRRVPGWI